MNTYKWFKGVLPFILVGLLFLVGLFIRLYRISEWMSWESDIGRDLLVARHISEFKESIFISPPSAGPYIINSPLYFWILTVLRQVFQSPQNIVYVYVFTSAIGIIFAYLTGVYFKNALCGYLFACFILINPYLQELSKTIWQPNFNQTLLLMCGALFGYWYKTQKKWILPLVIQLIFIAVHLYFSFFPIGLLLLLLIVGIMLKNAQHYRRMLYVTAIVIIINCLIFFEMTYARNTRFLFPLVTHVASRQFSISTVFSNILFTISLAYKSNISFIRYAIGLIWIIGYGFVYKTRNKKKIAPFIGATALYIFSMCIVSLFPQQGPSFYYRLFIYIPLIYFCISYIIASCPKYMHGVIYVLLCMWIGGSIVTAPVFTREPTNNYVYTYSVMQSIVHDYRQNTLAPEDVPSFHLYHMFNDPAQFASRNGHFWYLAELLTDKQLVRLSQETNNNLTPIITNPRYEYLICPKLVNQEINYTCKKSFLLFHNNIIDTTSEHLIVPEGKARFVYEIYRWSIR